jgi:dipeptidyl aminopeptidase/acylaminoacyl peptidase
VDELEGNGGYAGFSSTIQAAVPMGAQTDLLSERTHQISQSEERGEIWRQFLGGPQAGQLDTYRMASPLAHLDASDAPMLFITGANDDPSTHADGLRNRMMELGIKQDLLVIDEAPHAFLARQNWFDQAVDAAAIFFSQCLNREQ